MRGAREGEREGDGSENGGEGRRDGGKEVKGKEGRGESGRKGLRKGGTKDRGGEGERGRKRFCCCALALTNRLRNSSTENKVEEVF